MDSTEASLPLALESSLLGSLRRCSPALSTLGPASEGSARSVVCRWRYKLWDATATKQSMTLSTPTCQLSKLSVFSHLQDANCVLVQGRAAWGKRCLQPLLELALRQLLILHQFRQMLLLGLHLLLEFIMNGLHLPFLSFQALKDEKGSAASVCRSWLPTTMARPAYLKLRLQVMVLA